jgi:hypothetical protein
LPLRRPGKKRAAPDPFWSGSEDQQQGYQDNGSREHDDPLHVDADTTDRHDRAGYGVTGFILLTPQIRPTATCRMNMFHGRDVPPAGCRARLKTSLQATPKRPTATMATTTVANTASR